MKTKIIIATLFIVTALSLSSFLSCDGKSLTYPQPQPNGNEFIISMGGAKGFKVVNIHSSMAKYVPAVKELGANGRMYQLFFSSMPTFNGKIVEGTFVPDTNYYLSLRDTIFRVTKHLRDTTIFTVGQ